MTASKQKRSTKKTSKTSNGEQPKQMQDEWSADLVKHVKVSHEWIQHLVLRVENLELRLKALEDDNTSLRQKLAWAVRSNDNSQQP